MNRPTLLLRVCLGLLPLGAVCCVPEGKMTMPTSFVELDVSDRAEFAARGLSADDCVIALRIETNPHNGSVGYWTDAVGHELARRGYALAGQEPFTTGAGLNGQLLKFTRRDMVYWIAVLVEGDRIALPEAGGKTDTFKRHEADVLAAFRSVRL